MKNVTLLLLALFISVLSYAQVDLPIDFESTTTDYMIVDFGNNTSQIVADPTDGSNTVVQTTKPDNAETWAGTTAGGDGLANPIPFASDATKMTVRVWSPDAGIPVLLKVENKDDGNISVETLANTTMANAWETLEFDFGNATGGGLDLNQTYNKVSIFFNFGVAGADAGAKTYYWDDVQMGAGGGLNLITLPITFDDASQTYEFTEFGGSPTMVVDDPTDPANKVAQTLKAAGSETWSGVIVGSNGLAEAIPFASDATVMTVRVWSPKANIPVRMKLENAANSGIAVEKNAIVPTANEWVTLEYDFSDVGLNINESYNKVIMFFDFDTAGDDTNYYFDDIQMGSGGGVSYLDFPITFDDSDQDYILQEFGGSPTMVVDDPTDPANKVAQTLKAAGAETWSGVIAGANGLSEPIPFTMDDTKISMDIWAPVVGETILLKLENLSDPNVNIEVAAQTTTAMQWETLVFDFGDVVDLNQEYQKVIVFFNFGNPGNDATYYWDNVKMEGTSNTTVLPAAAHGINVFPNPAQDLITIEFEEARQQDVRVTILGANGQQIRQQVLRGQQATLDVSSLSAGVYFIRLDDQDKSYFQKLMIK